MLQKEPDYPFHTPFHFHFRQAIKMASRNTSYCPSWRDTVEKNEDGINEKYDWITPVPGDPNKVKCSLCLTKPFSVSSGGIADCKQHAKGKMHKGHVKSRAGQRTLFNGSSGVAVWSETEKVRRAEIMNALHTVDANISFSSASGDNDRFRQMFPDSQVAKKYQMGETKMKYLVQFGIAPHIKSLILKDFEHTPFSFKFDETTTSQTKKQYDAYVTYFSKTMQQVLTTYAGSVFVGHCTDAHLLEHFRGFMRELKLDTNYLLSIGMDGPYVNLSFERKLREELQVSKGNNFLSIGSCVLHTVNNSFGEGMKIIKLIIDIEQFLCDVHFFFKLSAARREDYREIEAVTNVAGEFAVKYSSTRWLYIGKAIVRVVEQIDNLKEYFLVTLPQTKGFKYKTGVGNTERYKRIKGMLENKMFLPACSFIVFTSQIYNPFVQLFQRKEPLIHILTEQLRKLVTDLFNKFLSDTYLSSLTKNGKIPLDTMLKTDVDSKKNYRAEPQMGAKTKSLLDALGSFEKKKFVDNVVFPFYAECAGYLLKNLPLKKQVIRDAKYLHPNSRSTSSTSVKGIARLTRTLAQCLGDAFHDVFQLKKEATVDSLVDEISCEWSLYSIDDIPSSLIFKDEKTETAKRKSQPSYWKYAYGLCGIDDYDVNEDDYKFRRIDEYWLSIGKFTDDVTGKLKYKNLSKLALCVMVLPHGNAEPERGFSINKYMLSVHGSALKEETIVALRIVKDEIIRVGGIMNVKISKDMIRTCDSAYKNYAAYLDAEEEKKKEKMKRKDEAVHVENAKKKKDELAAELNELKCKALSLKKDVIAAHEVSKEGNLELAKCLQKSMDKDQLRRCQMKIDMGLKRKEKLDEEVDAVEKKIAKVEGKLRRKNI